MKILATSDIHGNKALIHLALKILKKEQADALIIAGDIAPKGFYRLFREGSGCSILSAFPVKDELLTGGNEFEIKRRLDLLGFVEQSGNSYELSDIRSKQKEKLKEICRLLKSAEGLTTNIPVFLLIGNDDHIPDSDWDKILKNFGILNLNLKTHNLDKWQVTGFQYVLPTPWNTNNELPDDELAKKLRRIENQVDRKTIFITHGPPKGVLDRVANGLRAGSESIFNLVKERQPAFHIFGHIHEAFGNDNIDNTICCNASCLWNDWLLRGYVIDTETRGIREIKRRISLSDFKRI